MHFRRAIFLLLIVVLAVARMSAVANAQGGQSGDPADPAEAAWRVAAEVDQAIAALDHEEFAERGPKSVMTEARKLVGDSRTYVSFDIDALDPSIAPGTGTPEIGGITTREAQALVRLLEGVNIIGADLVEVAPPLDQTGATALAGATMMFELLCVMASSGRSDRRS